MLANYSEKVFWMWILHSVADNNNGFEFSPWEDRPISNAFGKYILMDTGLIGFLNHKFYGKRHARRPLLLLCVSTKLRFEWAQLLSLLIHGMHSARMPTHIIDSPINKVQIKIGSNHITKATENPLHSIRSPQIKFGFVSMGNEQTSWTM